MTVIQAEPQRGSGLQPRVGRRRRSTLGLKRTTKPFNPNGVAAVSAAGATPLGVETAFYESRPRVAARTRQPSAKDEAPSGHVEGPPLGDGSQHDTN